MNDNKLNTGTHAQKLRENSLTQYSKTKIFCFHKYCRTYNRISNKSVNRTLCYR